MEYLYLVITYVLVWNICLFLHTGLMTKGGVETDHQCCFKQPAKEFGASDGQAEL